MKKTTRTKKRSDAQLRAIRINYVIRASNAKKETKKKAVKKKCSTSKEELPNKVKQNPWNVHYLGNNGHSHIIIASKNKQAMALGTTSEVKTKHPKIKIKDGLVPNQNFDTYVLTSAKVISSNKIQKKKPNSRITPRDKDYIFDSIKRKPGNIEKYKKLGSNTEKGDKKKELIFSSSAQCFIPIKRSGRD